MNNPKFTKGEWKIQDDGYNLIGVSFRKGFGVLIGPKNKESLSNANLITAAPEMYRFLDDLANGRGIDYPIEQLLAKARGEHE